MNKDSNDIFEVEEKEEIKQVSFEIDKVKFDLKISDLQKITAIDSNKILYVANRDLTEKEETDEETTILKFPFHIELTAFIYFTELLSEINVVDINTELNFSDVKLLCDYFNTKYNITERMHKDLKNKFTNPKSIFTAFTILGEPNLEHEFKLSEVMNLTQFSYIDRLEFAIAHNNSDVWSKNIDRIDNVDEILNIPKELIDFLNPNECVIAGGSAMYLGCRWTKFTLRCDVDFFVFKNSLYIIEKMVQILKSFGYKICQSSPSVLTAIGYYGMRKIQIVYSSAENVDDLIILDEGFDINTIKCYYDGKYLYKTYGAEYDWIRKICSGGTYTAITSIRLFGMMWKGFKLTSEVMEYLSNTLGWPIPEDILWEYESNIPCLTKDIPESVQDFQLKKMGLPVIKDINLISTIKPLFNHYGPSGTFIGTYEKYVEHLSLEQEKEVKMKTSSRGYFPTINYPGRFIEINSKYLLKIPMCHFAFGYKYEQYKKDGNKRTVLSLHEKDYSRFREMESLIMDKGLRKFAPLKEYGYNDDINNIRVKTNDICCRIDETTEFIINGIPHNREIIFDRREQIIATGYPRYIHEFSGHYNIQFTKIVWQISSINCNRQISKIRKI